MSRLHTLGKTYLATASNTAANTWGHFRPEGLATEALPMKMTPLSGPGRPRGRDLGPNPPQPPAGDQR